MNPLAFDRLKTSQSNTLNKVTIKNRHPLSFINEAINRLAGAIVYTKLNLKNTYHKIGIKSEDK
jgi:hypothetical protein